MCDANGIIYLAATPIGNPGDASGRLREALETADVIAAEDTRRLRGLCSRLGIAPTAPVIPFHEHVEVDRSVELVAAAKKGKTVLVVSDAGTPTVSDPGFRLGQIAAREGVRLAPLPGPSAALAALSVSGLPSNRFVFEGFLPRKGAERRDRLSALAAETRTAILFESPRRTAFTLSDLADVLGHDRAAALCRELTKTHEEVIRGSLEQLAKHAQDTEILGEVTLVVGGAPRTESISVEALASRALALSAEDGLRLKEAAAQVAEGTGQRSNAVFRAALELR